MTNPRVPFSSSQSIPLVFSSPSPQLVVELQQLDPQKQHAEAAMRSGQMTAEQLTLHNMVLSKFNQLSARKREIEAQYAVLSEKVAQAQQAAVCAGAALFRARCVSPSCLLCGLDWRSEAPATDQLFSLFLFTG